MIQNRFFKSTLGIKADCIIAKNLNETNGTGGTGTAATSSNTATVSNPPVAGDELTFIIGGNQYTYLVPTPTITNTQLATALQTFLNKNDQGFTAAVSGTTALTVALSGMPNGTIVTMQENGNTFSALTPANFAGGVAGIVGFEPTLEYFVLNGVAGDVAVFWDDNNTAVTPGATKLAANSNRKIFYAWKQGTNTLRTAAVPVAGLKQTSVPYNAGTADVWVATFTGTYAVGQWLQVRVINKTTTTTPYDSYDYTEKITTDLATTLTALAARINKESSDTKIVSAVAGATTLTVTADQPTSTIIQLLASLDTNGVGTDNSVVTIANTVKGVAPVGTLADVTYFENFSKVAQGVMIYAGSADYTPLEFNNFPSNVDGSIQYGYVTITAARTERGETRSYSDKAYIIIALPTADRALLTAL